MIPETRIITIGDTITLGGNARLVLIAGPCVIENSTICFETAEALTKLTASLNMPFIFKASFDKANRSSISSFRGPGLDKGMGILRAIKEQFGIPVTTDIHAPQQAAAVAETVDIIQIPAFLCRQTDLLVAAAETGLPVNVKKGQFLSPAETANIVHKVEAAGNPDVCLTERGTTFGYNRLINDFSGVQMIRETGVPLIYDATHSVQQPGGEGDHSGGASQYVPCLSRAAAAVGIDGLFIETHPEPDKAMSDGPNMVALPELRPLLETLLKIDDTVKPPE